MPIESAVENNEDLQLDHKLAFEFIKNGDFSEGQQDLALHSSL